MNELNAIIEALNNLGVEAKSAFMLWVVLAYGVKIINAVVVWGVFATLAYLITKTVRWCVDRTYPKEIQ